MYEMCQKREGEGNQTGQFCWGRTKESVGSGQFGSRALDQRRDGRCWGGCEAVEDTRATSSRSVADVDGRAGRRGLRCEAGENDEREFRILRRDQNPGTRTLLRTRTRTVQYCTVAGAERVIRNWAHGQKAKTPAMMDSTQAANGKAQGSSRIAA